MYPYKIFGDFDLYTIFITLGAAGCLLLLRLLADRIRLPARLTNLVLAGGLGGMAAGLGSAVLFQAFYDYLAGNGFLLDAHTGSTFYGGLIGGAAAFLLIYFVAGHFLFPAREHVANFFPMAGLAAASITFAHAFGRVGCFMLGCCHGLKTDSVFGLYFPALGMRVYPTQLYEAFFLALLCAFLSYRALHKHGDGLPLYLVAYGVFRYFIEFLRGDDRGASPVPFLSPSQLTALILVAVGMFLYWLEARIRQKQSAAASSKAATPAGALGEVEPSAVSTGEIVSVTDSSHAAAPIESSPTTSSAVETPSVEVLPTLASPVETAPAENSSIGEEGVHE